MADPRKPDAAMAAVREALLRRHDEGATFDVLVTETGISRAGLYKFLDNPDQQPYRKNRKKLLKWHREQPPGPDGPDVAGAEGELEYLAAGHLDDESAGFLLPRMAELFDQDARRQGKRPARWVEQLLRGGEPE